MTDAVTVVALAGLSDRGGDGIAYAAEKNVGGKGGTEREKDCSGWDNGSILRDARVATNIFNSLIG
jgi:hypothetical protein